MGANEGGIENCTGVAFYTARKAAHFVRFVRTCGILVLIRSNIDIQKSGPLGQFEGTFAD